MALTRRSPTAQAEQPPVDTPPGAAAAPAVSAPPAPAVAAPPVASAPAPAAADTAPAVASAPPPASVPALVVNKPLALVRRNPIIGAIGEGRAVFDSLKDALRVQWDTLDGLKAVQGRISTKDDKLVLGEWIEFEALSVQENWLLSPGSDTDEARTLARYSDDGVMLKDGSQTCAEYLAHLKEMGYKDAKRVERLVLVISLTDCDKDVKTEDVEGKLFQIDMPPTSRQAFDRYKNQTAFDIAKKRFPIEEVFFMRATCTVETQRGSNKQYTMLNFSRSKSVPAPAPAAA